MTKGRIIASRGFFCFLQISVDKRERIWYSNQVAAAGNATESPAESPAREFGKARKQLRKLKKRLDKRRETQYTNKCSADAACTL
ncbi:MAG: hypothetical protein RR089_08250, partial [Acidaminococcaceae bacterium]